MRRSSIPARAVASVGGVVRMAAAKSAMEGASVDRVDRLPVQRVRTARLRMKPAMKRNLLREPDAKSVSRSLQLKVKAPAGGAVAADGVVDAERSRSRLLREARRSRPARRVMSRMRVVGVRAKMPGARKNVLRGSAVAIGEVSARVAKDAAVSGADGRMIVGIMRFASGLRRVGRVVRVRMTMKAWS